MTDQPDDVGREPTGRIGGGLLEPSRLRPVELDLGVVFWALTGCFALALTVCGVIALTGSVPGRTVAICATGVGLGFLGQGWLRWRDAAQRRRERATGTTPDARDAAATPGDDPLHGDPLPGTGPGAAEG